MSTHQLHYGIRSSTSYKVDRHPDSITDCSKCLSPLPQCSYLVILDRLDECHDKTTQKLILQLLYESIKVHKLLLRFLVGSRPEFHIHFWLGISLYNHSPSHPRWNILSWKRYMYVSARWFCKYLCWQFHHTMCPSLFHYVYNLQSMA